MILLIRRHLSTWGDIFRGQTGWCATSLQCTEGSPQCTGCPLPPVRNGPDQNGNTADTEKPWIRAKEDRELLNKRNPLPRALSTHGIRGSVRNVFCAVGYFQTETVLPAIRGITEEIQILNCKWSLNMCGKLHGAAHRSLTHFKKEETSEVRCHLWHSGSRVRIKTHSYGIWQDNGKNTPLTSPLWQIQ